MALFDIKGRDALSQTAANDGTNLFDNSGWNVNFGAGKIDSNRTQTDSAAAGALSVASPYLPYALAAVGLVIAWRLTHRRR